jgi:hypothetical protein
MQNVLKIKFRISSVVVAPCDRVQRSQRAVEIEQQHLVRHSSLRPRSSPLSSAASESSINP